MAKKRNLFLSLIMVTILAFSTASCTTQENVIGGTGLGAGFGALVGAIVGDPAMGAAIGAGAGAIVGLTKDSMEKEGQNRERYAQTNYEIAQLRAELNQQKEATEIANQKEALRKRGFTEKAGYDLIVTREPGGKIKVIHQKRNPS